MLDSDASATNNWLAAEDSGIDGYAIQQFLFVHRRAPGELRRILYAAGYRIADEIAPRSA
jgi:hypothetical protein